MPTPGRRFAFTITTGRSGTAFLRALVEANVPESECHHEILGWDRFGVDTPDVSHMTLFNSEGNGPKVRDFWRQKMDRIAASPAPLYCESSHLLAKCGLIENVELLTAVGEVHLIELRRDIYATATSHLLRSSFVDYGATWLWYLDPRYPNNIIKVGGTLSTVHMSVWYVLEMRARAAYYRRLLADRSDVHMHTVELDEIVQPQGAREMLMRLGWSGDTLVLPAAQNAGKSTARLPPDADAELRTLIDSTSVIDTEQEGRAAYDRGFRF